MNEIEQNTKLSGKRTKDQIESLWDGAIQFHKSGLTITLALLLGMLTVTGFAVQNNRAELFLIAAGIAFFAFVIDWLVKYHLIAPFLYKVLSLEIQQSPEEPLGLLFLDFGVGDESRFLEVFKLSSGSERQHKFRKLYMKKNRALKIIIYGLGFGGEILFYIIFR